MPLKRFGVVTEVAGYVVKSTGLKLPIGSICSVFERGQKITTGLIVQIDGLHSTLYCFKEAVGASSQSIVVFSESLTDYVYSPDMVGSVVNCYGQTVAGSKSNEFVKLEPKLKAFHERRSVSSVFDTGVSALNCFVPIGYGQRIGLFAGSGVGKSVLMSMVAKASEADFCVCALIGERSREIVDFMEKTLTPTSREKTVIVAEPAQSSALEKIRATELAIRIAEYQASQGKKVVFLFDSLTRYAHALREYGLASGEVPTMRGYPPSVFSKLPALIERAGAFDVGSITGIFTVLMDGDDENDPVVDTARAILDGHIMMDRKLASKGIYPAIDICKSVSRCAQDVVSPNVIQKALRVKSLVAVKAENADLITMGAYVKGANPLLDEAISKENMINAIIKQSPSERRTLSVSHQYLYGIVN